MPTRRMNKILTCWRGIDDSKALGLEISKMVLHGQYGIENEENNYNQGRSNLQCGVHKHVPGKIENRINLSLCHIKHLLIFSSFVLYFFFSSQAHTPFLNLSEENLEFLLIKSCFSSTR